MSPDSIAIRDAAEALLASIDFDGTPAFKFVGRVPVEQEPDDDLPSLLVIASREQMQADGDANAGEPSFVVDLTLSVLISLSADLTTGETDPKTARDRADERLTDRIGAVQGLLLRTPAFLALFDGVSSINSTRVFDKPGERFFARARIEMTVQYRCHFPPIVPDDLERVAITAKMGGPFSPMVRARVVIPT